MGGETTGDEAEKGDATRFRFSETGQYEHEGELLPDTLPIHALQCTAEHRLDLNGAGCLQRVRREEVPTKGSRHTRAELKR